MIINNKMDEEQKKVLKEAFMKLGGFEEYKKRYLEFLPITESDDSEVRNRRRIFCTRAETYLTYRGADLAKIFEEFEEYSFTMERRYRRMYYYDATELSGCHLGYVIERENRYSATTYFSQFLEEKALFQPAVKKYLHEYKDKTKEELEEIGEIPLLREEYIYFTAVDLSRIMDDLKKFDPAVMVMNHKFDVPLGAYKIVGLFFYK